jgi:hypothetical protein
MIINTLTVSSPTSASELLRFIRTHTPQDFSFDTLVPMPPYIGELTAWRLDHWGCIEDPGCAEIEVDESTGEYKYTFYTSTRPLAWLLAASRFLIHVDFTLRCRQAGSLACWQCKVSHGEIISEPTGGVHTTAPRKTKHDPLYQGHSLLCNPTKN